MPRSSSGRVWEVGDKFRMAWDMVERYNERSFQGDRIVHCRTATISMYMGNSVYEIDFECVAWSPIHGRWVRRVDWMEVHTNTLRTCERMEDV